jgi:hypothetical protein
VSAELISYPRHRHVDSAARDNIHLVGDYQTLFSHPLQIASQNLPRFYFHH